MQKTWGFLLFAIFFSIGLISLREPAFENPYPPFCEFIVKKIYLPESATRDWKRTCLSRSSLVKRNSPKALIIQDMNNVLALLKTSHLQVFDANETKSIWSGEAKETGIESDYVDGELVIFKVEPHSPAAKVGLQFGDVIAGINGEHPTPSSAREAGGTFLVDHQGHRKTILMTTDVLKRDEFVRAQKISGDTVLLKIPSFRSEFFGDDELKTVAKDLLGKKKMILDLRGNIGGNFVAGLRFLSLFFCKPTTVGYLDKPKLKNNKISEMPDDLKDQDQGKILDESKRVILKTFASQENANSCFAGEIKILIDSGTASVAEMVALALQEKMQARLYGTITRGELLVGVWYPFDELGAGVQVSVPEAMYVSDKGYQLEGHGLKADRTLYYDLQEMKAGIDSWVKRVLD
jgi:carboxyl-terminal processing protease